jgi:vacuolar-type H+-ATPase subunit I/STV1
MSDIYIGVSPSKTYVHKSGAAHICSYLRLFAVILMTY